VSINKTGFKHDQTSFVGAMLKKMTTKAARMERNSKLLVSMIQDGTNHDKVNVFSLIMSSEWEKEGS